MPPPLTELFFFFIDLGADYCYVDVVGRSLLVLTEMLFWKLVVYKGFDPPYEGRFSAAPMGVCFLVLSIVKEETRLLVGDSIPELVDVMPPFDLYLVWLVVK